jgi:4-diphosphocytidyl-2C-methyl-D-erythritol kinase
MSNERVALIFPRSFYFLEPKNYVNLTMSKKIPMAGGLLSEL